MMPRPAAACAAAALSLFVFTGCASSTVPPSAAPTGSARSTTAPAASNAGLTDSALLAAFKKAADSATAVHVKGTTKEGAQTASLDLQLNRVANTAQGTIGTLGATIPVISVGGVDYFQLTDSVIKLSGAEAIAPLIRDKWVASDSEVGQGMDSDFKSLISYRGFIAEITSADSGGLTGSTAAGTTIYNGQTVAVYKGDDGTEAYFAANGPAYLLAITGSSSSQEGALTFVWNRPTTVTAPPASQIYKG